MEKVNIFSVFIFNPFRRLSKKYLLFLFMTMAILLCYGFFFTTKVHAEENVTFIEVNEDIIKDTIWSETSKPYVVTNDITVGKGATLTIEPGVLVKFMSDTDLYITGKLIADGTKEPIYFTSNYDDTVGGSTDDDWSSCDYEDYVKDDNGDYFLDENGNLIGIGKEICEYFDWYDPEAGDWDGIHFKSSNDSGLKNVFFKYADEAITFESSNIEINNLNISDGVSGITGHDNSIIKIVNGNINNLEGDAFTFWGNSSLSLENITLQSSGIFIFGGSSLNLNKTLISDTYDGLEISQGSSVVATDSSIVCENNGIMLYDNSILNFSNGSVTCGNDGIALYNEVTANISGVKITGAQDAGIVAFSNVGPNNINITKSEITGNANGFIVWNSPISVHQNSIHDNTVSGVTTSDVNPATLINYDFTSNYWGDSSGPKNETSNPTGLGNKVSDNILFKPFLKYDPTKERKDPIIIVPGIMGTELIRDYGDKDEIWPAVSKVVFSLFDNYLKELSLLQNGEENPDFSMTKGDIIRDIPTSDIFKGLVSELENNGGYKEGENLFVFPYDWRFSNTKNAELLKEKIDQVLADTEKDKVDIIAHSMGGLLTKEYIKENGEENKIDHLIFLGTPHLGAPKAYKALIYGDSMGFGISVNNTELLKFLNDKVVKIISQNMPSIYELLPSQKYVAGIRYISEKTIGSDPAYLDYDATKNLLIEKKVNQPMLESAETFHQGIDEIDLSDIKVSNFSACGEATLSAINIRKEVSIGPIKLKEDYKLKYANGDSTVPLDSSFGIANVDKYFVDKVSHSALPSAPDVPEAVLNALEDKAPQAKSKVFQDVSNCTPINGYILGMHSPISLDIYDTNGNHSGLDIDGNIESNIEGVSYDTIGDAKFAFIPDGLNVNVKGSATGFGTFDLSIEKVIGGETTETKFWNDVPITSTSHMSFNFNSYTNTNTIELDNNGSKRSIAISNVLSQGEDYLAVPVKITETRKQSSSGSYIIKNNSKIVTSIPNTEIKQGIVVDIKKVDIEKQPIIKKPLAKVIEKKVVINKETIIPTSNLGASVINAGQDIDFWGTIRSFFRRLFHIKK